MAFRIASLSISRRAADLTYRRTFGLGTTRILARSYASALPEEGSTKGGYVSPFQEIFDTIKEGKTSLGTTKFEKPDIKYLECGIPENLLRFKSTTYGRLLEEPFVRPNEHKVTLQVASRHLPLTDMERMVLKEIVGTRLNDETGVLQLSSVQFGSRIENKRHCVSMLNRIVDSAKSLAARVQAEAEGKAVET